MIGLVILGLIFVPLISLMIASILEPPRTFRVAGLFTVSVLLQIGILILGFVIFATVLGLIVTQ